MTLREFLFFNDMTIVDMATMLGISRTHLSGIAHGRYNASRKLADTIYYFTQCKVDLRKEKIAKKKKEP